MPRNEETDEPGPETMCKPFDTDMGKQTKGSQKTVCRPAGPGCSRHHTDDKTMSVRAREKVSNSDLQVPSGQQ